MKSDAARLFLFPFYAIAICWNLFVGLLGRGAAFIGRRIPDLSKYLN